MTTDDIIADAEARDHADAEQVRLHHGEGRAEAERRLAWLMTRYNECKGWREES